MSRGFSPQSPIRAPSLAANQNLAMEATRSNIIEDVLTRVCSYTLESGHVLLRMSKLDTFDMLHSEESVYDYVAHDGPIKTCSILLIDAD